MPRKRTRLANESEDLDLNIAGSYLRHGNTNTIPRSALPEEIVEMVLEFDRRIGLKKPELQSMAHTDECIGLRLHGRTSFRWAREGRDAACQTCSTTRLLCLR